MKRFFAMLLTLALCAGMMTCMAATASAENITLCIGGKPITAGQKYLNDGSIDTYTEGDNYNAKLLYSAADGYVLYLKGLGW